jgi:hypothetical protein
MVSGRNDTEFPLRKDRIIQRCLGYEAPAGVEDELQEEY